jgi:hypothetical protein
MPIDRSQLPSPETIRKYCTFPAAPVLGPDEYVVPCPDCGTERTIGYTAYLATQKRRVVCHKCRRKQQVANRKLTQ